MSCLLNGLLFIILFPLEKCHRIIVVITSDKDDKQHDQKYEQLRLLMLPSLLAMPLLIVYLEHPLQLFVCLFGTCLA